MKTPRSISMDELSTRVEEAVAATLVKHQKFSPGKLELGYLPDPGIFGFILDREHLSNFNASELSAFSSDVVANFGDFAADIEPVALLRDHGATMGFFPRAAMVALGKTLKQP